ncbi:ribokinase-like domain-containing protein [Sulfitobacter noctilucicola]|uniref:Fructokinase n=1 Tax=Sulfitobacter noctilucicola TaxID=1342301 RepID=A0A7W6M8Q0_9RHOB|nr:carbohydrate kinase [Sulfitobacter noctilucicola]KIN64480.1 ribokinase-like domain-containing protein [Sulfitobacter noctilucicola]MBB4174361.1 fructokinase [Sulfitobacter noctilucicola]
MILCCGEALIDMIPVAGPDGQTAFVPHCGGALFNTAIALGRLDVPVGMLSGVSRDRFGVQLADALSENNVQTDMLVRSDRATTLAIVHLVDGHATYAFYDEGSAGRMVRPADVPDIPEAVEALYFGGISLVSEPAADTYAHVCATAGGSRLVMMDPNIRTSFITDEQAYRARLDRMMPHCDIVKVSDEDLAWMTGGSGSIADQAKAVLAKGPKFVIVTKGAEGAMVFSDGGHASVPAGKAVVVDTVGAGDTFNAGVLAGLTQQGALSKEAVATLSAEDLVPALSYGAKVAAVTVSRAGANPPWKNEL